MMPTNAATTPTTATMATSTIGSDESPVLAVGDEDVVPEIAFV